VREIAGSVVLAALVIGAALIFSGRYVLVRPTGEIGGFFVWRLDRLTGEVCQVNYVKDTGGLVGRCFTAPAVSRR